jgi:hypothetical protein
VQQNFRDPLTKRLLSEIALNSPPMANGNAARLFGGKLPPRRPIPRWTLGAIISALSNLHWSTFAATSRKNRYDGTKSNFVAILQVSVSNKNAIDLCPVC